MRPARGVRQNETQRRGIGGHDYVAFSTTPDRKTEQGLFSHTGIIPYIETHLLNTPLASSHARSRTHAGQDIEKGRTAT